MMIKMMSSSDVIIKLTILFFFQSFGTFSTVAFVIDAVLYFMENKRASVPPPLGAEQF